MQSVGQAWLVLDLTGSALGLGFVVSLQFGPLLVLSFVGGALADRFPKRRLLMASQSALACQALILATLAATGQVRYWHVALLAIVHGIVNTVDMPTRQSFIVEMVGKPDLPQAIALNSAMFNGARIVGPAVAGLLVSRYGVAPAFLVNALSFLAVIGALAALRTEGRPRAPRTTSVRQDIAEGVRFAAGSPRIALALGLLLAVSLFVLNHSVLVPLLAREVLHVDARGFGLLMASVGAGALAGALTVAGLGRRPPSLRRVVAAAVMASAGTLAVAAVRGFAPAAVALGVIGFAQIVFMASANALLQLGTPDDMRGRMMSLYATVFMGVTPIGAFLMGALAEAFGVPAAYAAGGTLGLGAVLGLTVAARRSLAATASRVVSTNDS
jgi:MFS family permease